MPIVQNRFGPIDHCMELREHAGGDKDLFSAERKMRKQRQKMEQQREKEYQREKAREKNNVFNFINTTLGDKGWCICFLLFRVIIRYHSIDNYHLLL